VKLLFDENLSRRLVQKLSDLFPESSHVATQHLLRSPDRVIWDFAREHDFALVTADADFYELAITLGSPPKVIWLRGCDYPTAIGEQLIRSQSIRISEFMQDPVRAVLILKP
jgi:predicted nuclease of predicted toxin-antitoxin system